MKGIEFVAKYGLCDHDSHDNDPDTAISNGLFVVRLNDGSQRTATYCRDCTLAIPTLTLWANAEYSAMTKPYTLTGKYLRRKFDNNHYKVLAKYKRSDPLILQLKALRNLGYRVPMFASDTQIAVTSSEIHHDSKVDRMFKLQVELKLWQNFDAGTKGYQIMTRGETEL